MTTPSPLERAPVRVGRRRPGPRRRRWPLAAIAVTLVAILALVWFILRDDDGPGSSLSSFLAEYEQRDYGAAASLTDGEREQVAAALKANVDGLDGASLEAGIESVNETGDDEAEASVSMRWQVPDIGEFAYVNAGDPPPTHAWFIAARDGLAISVLLEDRPSGGSHAAPVAAPFFDALARRDAA